ncbi:hypothetical protein ABPG72_002585 [Tetrahymena utriculariae]
MEKKKFLHFMNCEIIASQKRCKEKKNSQDMIFCLKSKIQKVTFLFHVIQANKIEKIKNLYLAMIIKLNFNQRKQKQEKDHFINTQQSDQSFFNQKSNHENQFPSYFQELKEANECNLSHVKFEENQMTNASSVNFYYVCLQNIQNQENSLTCSAQIEWQFVQSQVKCEQINQSASQVNDCFPSFAQNQSDTKSHQSQLKFEDIQLTNAKKVASLDGQQDLQNQMHTSPKNSTTVFNQFKVKYEENQLPYSSSYLPHIIQRLPNYKHQEFSTSQNSQSLLNYDYYKCKFQETYQTDFIQNCNSFKNKLDNRILEEEEEEENEEIEYVYANKKCSQQDIICKKEENLDHQIVQQGNYFT